MVDVTLRRPPVVLCSFERAIRRASMVLVPVGWDFQRAPLVV
jgi:hypothetical protein